MLELWRWPVKSMAGERLRATRLDGRGVAGDRSHAVLHEHKVRVLQVGRIAAGDPAIVD